MTIPEALDRAVHAARLDFMTPHGAPRRRNLRWLPLLILLVMPASYALLVAAADGRTGPWQQTMWLSFAGSLLFFFAFAAAQLVRLFGPRVGWEGGALDERELMLKARAGSVSGAIIATLAALACFYGGFAAVFGTWMPATVLEWVYLGLMIEAWALALPVLVASWLQPKLDEEED
jgi:hypothetical protein